MIDATGNGESVYGYTGEVTDPSGLVYLRARYYLPGSGRFISRDSWEGIPDNPNSLIKYLYSYNNPIIFTDPSGLSPIVDCSQIILNDLKQLCIQGNGDDNAEYVLHARWMFFDKLANYSMLASPIGEGYWWAGKMLKYFLNKTNNVHIYLSSSTSLSTDPGILRATKKLLPASAHDEPINIDPLLRVLIRDTIIPNGICTGQLINSSIKLFTIDQYTGKYPPRPHNRGWWGAFGHFDIETIYSGITITKNNPGYTIFMRAKNHVDDDYRWFVNTATPFDFPVSMTRIEIPHEWELSLVPRRAAFFNYTIDWDEFILAHVDESLKFYDFYPDNQMIPIN